VRLLLHWVLSALAVWIVAHVVPGISVSGPVAALIAAAAIGLITGGMAGDWIPCPRFCGGFYWRRPAEHREFGAAMAGDTETQR